MKQKNKLRYYLAFITVILIANHAFAFNISSEVIQWSEQHAPSDNEFINELFSDGMTSGKSMNWGYFIMPNEQDPCQALELFKEVIPNRPVISVGTERGFIDAAITKASHLLLVDLSEGVCVFNTINALLLKASKDRNDYSYLRLEASASEWIERFHTIDAEFEASNRHTAIQSLWNFWNNRVRLFSYNGSFAEFHNQTRTEFVNINYLFDQDLYDHLKWMADQDRIHAFVQDFTTVKKDSPLSKCLDKINLKIGLLDLSNIFDIELYCYNIHYSNSGSWIQHDTALIMLLAFQKYIDDASILLSTAGKDVLTQCREHFLDNIGVLNYVESSLECIANDWDDPLYQDKNIWWGSSGWVYSSIRAKGLLPTNVDIETISKFINDYQNKMCKVDEVPVVNENDSDNFLFKNWGPRCMTEAEKWPVKTSSFSRDKHHCEPSN